MPFRNFIEETCTGTGATVTLTGNTANSREFQDIYTNGQTFTYVIEDANGINVVGGTGTWNTGNTITRNDSFNFDAGGYDPAPLGNLTLSAGTHIIRVSPIAADFNRWDEAYGWGDHAGLYLPISGGTLTSNLTIGSGGSSNYVRSYYNDGSYTDYTGYGVQIARVTGYIRPTTDNTATLFIGDGNQNISWNIVRVEVANNNNLRVNNNIVYNAGNFIAGTDYQAPLSNVAFTNADNDFSVNQTFGEFSQTFQTWRAHGMAAGNTTRNELRLNYTGTYDRFYVVPAKNGVTDFNKEFGYDFVNERWYLEGNTLNTGDMVVTGRVDAQGSNTSNFYALALSRSGVNLWADDGSLQLGSDVSTTIATIDSSGLTVTGSVLPVSDAAHNLGSASADWANLYVNNVRYGGGSASTYQYVPTDMLRTQTQFGYGDFGPANSSWCHIQTDRANFYMNTGLSVNGILRPHTDSARTLGTSSFRWSTIYGDNLVIDSITISGTIDNIDLSAKAVGWDLAEDAWLAQAEADLNLAYSAGAFYWANTGANLPVASSYGMGFNIVSQNSWDHNNTNNWIFQMGCTTGEALFFREKTNDAVWGGWQRIFTDSYHPNADTWTTSRTLSLTGDVTGTSAAFNGSGNISITTDVPELATKLNYYSNPLNGTNATYNSGWNTTTNVPVIGTTVNSTSSTGFPTEFGVTWAFKSQSGNDASDWQRQFEIYKVSSSSFQLYARGRNNIGDPTSWERFFTDAYHPNADRLTTARNISIGGDVTGSVSFDGSANVSITATVVDDSHNHVISNVDGLQTALNAKLDSSAYETPAITSDGATPTLNSGITAAEIRSLIGAGTGNGTMSSFNVQANGGTQIAITNTEELNFINGTNTTVAVTNQTNPTVQVNVSSFPYASLTGTPSIPAAANNATITLSAGTDLTGGGNFTTDQANNETLTFNVSSTSGAATANTLVKRNGSGDIFARLIRQTYTDQSTISGGLVFRVNNSTDNYLRVCNNAAAIRTFLNVDVAGTANYTHPAHPGDDCSVDTGVLSGATVISDLDFNVTTDTQGHVTDCNATFATRNLTANDIGAASQVTTEGGTATRYVMFCDGTGNTTLRRDLSFTYNPFTNTANAVIFNSTSDIREKNVHGIYTDGIAYSIQAHTYDWKKEARGKNHIGYIAQEVEKILPQAVGESDDGIKSVNYNMVHTAKIAELESKIEQLTELVSKLLGGK